MKKFSEKLQSIKTNKTYVDKMNKIVWEEDGSQRTLQSLKSLREKERREVRKNKNLSGCKNGTRKENETDVIKIKFKKLTFIRSFSNYLNYFLMMVFNMSSKF